MKDIDRINIAHPLDGKQIEASIRAQVERSFPPFARRRHLIFAWRHLLSAVTGR